MSPRAQLTIASVVLGFGASYVIGRAAIRKRCKKVVRKQCRDVPLFSDEYCEEQAIAICEK